MRRLLFWAGNAVAAAALVLLAIDPTRDLRPVLALVGAGVLLAWVAPPFFRPKGGK
jgi:hypothetical protein